jgi:hypothetical protein
MRDAWRQERILSFEALSGGIVLEEAVNLSSDITDGDDVIANNLPEM